MGAIYQDGEAWRARILIGYDPATGKAVYKKVGSPGTELEFAL